jgi:hypothetical protein
VNVLCSEAVTVEVDQLAPPSVVVPVSIEPSGLDRNETVQCDADEHASACADRTGAGTDVDDQLAQPSLVVKKALGTPGTTAAQLVADAHDTNASVPAATGIVAAVDVVAPARRCTVSVEELTVA